MPTEVEEHSPLPPALSLSKFHDQPAVQCSAVLRLDIWGLPDSSCSLRSIAQKGSSAASHVPQHHWQELVINYVGRIVLREPANGVHGKGLAGVAIKSELPRPSLHLHLLSFVLLFKVAIVPYFATMH